MKNAKFVYPVVDLKKTGTWLRLMCSFHGYSVKDVQEYLHISSNQAIYEWFNGHTLPSVNNLLALSNLFGVPMNSLLVDNIHSVIKRDDREYTEDIFYRRFKGYIIMLSANNTVRL